MKRFVSDVQGATAIEYCLIATSISIVIVAAAANIGQSVLGFFQAVEAGF